MEQLINEFKKLTSARIRALEETVAAGLLSDMLEYKRLTGQRDGLRESLELADQALANLMKR